MSSNINYKDALKQFYELKKEYEDKKMANLRDPHKKKNIPNCISCGRMVGTIFKTKLITEKTFHGRRLTAICGDTSKPCELDIKIDIEFFYPFRTEIQQYTDLIDKHKQNIITIKNDAMFFDTQNAVDNFNETIETLRKDISQQTAYINQFRESINRKDTHKLELDLNGLISENKQLFKTYKKQIEDGENIDKLSENPITSIVETYCKNIVKTVSEIQKRKYAITFMDIKKISGVDKYTLVQIPNNPQDFLYPKESGNEYDIKTFETQTFGSTLKQTKKARTDKPKKPKNKTVKAVKDTK